MLEHRDRDKRVVSVICITARMGRGELEREVERERKWQYICNTVIIVSHFCLILSNG
jgi:hypothetical protein